MVRGSSPTLLVSGLKNISLSTRTTTRASPRLFLSLYNTHIQNKKSFQLVHLKLLFVTMPKAKPPKNLGKDLLDPPSIM